MNDVNLKVKKSVLLAWPTLTDFGAFGQLYAAVTSERSAKKRIALLSKATPSPSKPLHWFAESGFEVFLVSEGTWKCFLVVTSYRCGRFKSENLPEAQHGA